MTRDASLKLHTARFVSYIIFAAMTFTGGVAFIAVTQFWLAIIVIGLMLGICYEAALHARKCMEGRA